MGVNCPSVFLLTVWSILLLMFFLTTLFFREKEYVGHCIAKIKVVSPSVSQDYQGKGLNLLTANRKTKCISCLNNGGLRLSDCLSMSL